MTKKFFLLLLLALATATYACAEGRAIPAQPAQWRDTMAQALDEAGLALDAPFVCAPFSQQLYAPNPAPDWLVYEATAAGDALYLRQILADEDTPITYYIIRINQSEKEIPEAFSAIAITAMCAMEPTLTHGEAADVLATLQTAQQNDPTEGHRYFPQGFLYSVGVGKDGALWDITIEYIFELL